MAAIPTQQIVTIGSQPTYQTPSGGAGDTFSPDSRTFMHIKASGTGCTATFTTFGAMAGVTGVGQKTMTCPTSGEKLVGPFDAAAFADPQTGLCTVTWNATAGISVAVFRL